MSRVCAVVGKSIMIHVIDVRPNDVLHISGDESDPIIEKVEFKDNCWRLIYKDNGSEDQIRHSLWTPFVYQNGDEGDVHIFVHDLMRERFEVDLG